MMDPMDLALRSLYEQRKRKRRRKRKPAAPPAPPTVNVTVNLPRAAARPHRRVRAGRPGEGSTAQRIMRDIRPSPG